MYANEEYATRLLRAGAAGFIIKDSPTSELLEAVRDYTLERVGEVLRIDMLAAARRGRPADLAVMGISCRKQIEHFDFAFSQRFDQSRLV